MDTRIKNIPDDFTTVASTVNISVNTLVKHYKVSAPIVNRWLRESNIQLRNTCIPWENRIDVNELKMQIANAKVLEDIDLYNNSKHAFRLLTRRFKLDTSHLVKYKDLYNEQIHAMLNQYKSVREISETLNVPYHYVTNTIAINNIKKPLTKVLSVVNNPEAFIKDCSKLTLREIQTKYNLSNYRAVEVACKELGIDTPLKLSEHWRTQYDEIVKYKDEIVKLNSKYTIAEIKDKLGIKASITVIYRFLSENNITIQKNSYNRSKGELEVAGFIKSLGIACSTLNRNYDSKRYEIDSYCHDYNFGVEYCGEYWHSINSGRPKNYHKDKQLWASKQGIRLIHIWEQEWINKKDLIKSMICSRLGINKRIYARKCIVQELTKSEARLFHELNHINGYVASSINIGLYSNEECIAVMSFAKSRFDRKYEYEITRMSFKMGVNVVGGASKLFKYFINTYDPESVMTYADLRFGEGKVYESIGMKFSTRTVPNYYYFNHNTLQLHSRMVYTKKQVLKLFPHEDSNSTEQEIMMRNGMLILYDCGNNKYVYTKKAGE